MSLDVATGWRMLFHAAAPLFGRVAIAGLICGVGVYATSNFKSARDGLAAAGPRPEAVSPLAPESDIGGGDQPTATVPRDQPDSNAVADPSQIPPASERSSHLLSTNFTKQQLQTVSELATSMLNLVAQERQQDPRFSELPDELNGSLLPQPNSVMESLLTKGELLFAKDLEAWRLPPDPRTPRALVMFVPHYAEPRVTLIYGNDRVFRAEILTDPERSLYMPATARYSPNPQ